MIYKKKSILTAIILIIIIQFLVYVNNNKKTSFKFFIWNAQEITIGKLISISFFSGFFISTFLDKMIITNNVKNSSKKENNKFNNNQNSKDDFKSVDTSKTEMPPQRDLRDTQPTISVNYRVIKSTGSNYLDDDEKNTNKIKNEDDWNNDEIDW